MIIVEGGPKLLNLEVPRKGRTKFAVTAGIEAINIPRKQYLIWRRSIPIEFLCDFSKKNSPPIILINTNIPKNG